VRIDTRHWLFQLDATLSRQRAEGNILEREGENKKKERKEENKGKEEKEKK